MSLLLAEMVSIGAPSDTPEATLADIAQVMTRQGFNAEMRIAKNGAEIVLRSCPFEQVAVEHADTVCSLHLGIA